MRHITLWNCLKASPGASTWMSPRAIRRWRRGYGRLLLVTRRQTNWLFTVPTTKAWLRTPPQFTHPVGVVLEFYRFRDCVRPGR